MSDLTRPIIGIENRTAQEVFDIMCDRIRSAEAKLAGGEAVKERRKFPILGSGGQHIDFELVADHGAQAQKNHYQSIQRLAERGGLAWTELYAVLHNKRWEKMDENEAMIACRALEQRYLSALTHPAPTHNDGSVEDQPDPEECERTAAFWGAEATKAMLQGDGDEAKRCLARSKRHALNAVRIRAIASGGKQ